MKFFKSPWLILIFVILILVGLSWYGYLFFKKDVAFVYDQKIKISDNLLEQNKKIDKTTINLIRKNKIKRGEDNKQSEYYFAVDFDYEDAFRDVKTQKYIENIPPDQVNEFFRQNLENWFIKYARQGVNIFDIPLFNLDAEVLYNSPTLFAAGYSYPEDMEEVLPVLLGLSRKYGISLSIPIEDFAHIIYKIKEYSSKIKSNKINKKLVTSVIKEIGDYAKRYNLNLLINEEAYESDYIDEIKTATAEKGIKYIHFFEDLDCRPDIYMSEDYAYYPRDAKNNEDDRKYLQFIQEQGSYVGKIGDLNAMFASAKACGKETAVGTAGGWGLGPMTHQNIALLRAIQFNPKYYQFIIASGDQGVIFPEEYKYVVNYNFQEKLLPLLKKFVPADKDRIKKSIANIILDYPEGISEDTLDYFENARTSTMSFITNTFLAMGYDIALTKNKILDNADIYYIFSPGLIWDEGKDLSDNLLALLKERRKKVIFQSAGKMEGKNWQKVWLTLGINEEPEFLYPEVEDQFFDPMPDKVKVEFPLGQFDINFAGYNFEADIKNLGNYPDGHFLYYINPDEISAKTLLVGYTAKDEDRQFNDKTALILNNNNFYLINGTQIHFGFSMALANILSKRPIYNAPSYGYFTRYELKKGGRAVFFAPYDTDVNVYVGKLKKIYLFDARGEEIPADNLKIENGYLVGNVSRFNLIVITE